MSEIVIDLSGGWSLAPIIDGVPDPKWLSWQPPTGIEGLAAVSEFLQRLSGEIAMVRDNPIYLPGTQERNLAAEELSFQTEISPLGLHFHAVALLVALATEMIHPVHYAIARSALEKDAPGYLDHPAAVEMLAQAFQEAAADLLKFLRPLRILDGWKVTTDFDWPSFTDAKVLSEEEEQEILEQQRQSLENVWPVKDGMFVFDAAFVAWIETYLHEYGLDYANEVRESSQARWQQYSQEVGYQYPEVKLYGNAGLFVLWIDITRGPLTPGPDRGPVPARWPRGLCRTLWRAFVKAKVERLPKYPPSITGYAQHHLTMMRKPAGTRETLQGVELIDQSGTAIGHFQDRRDVIGVDGEAVQELLRSGIEQLPRLMVERLLRGWLLDVDAQAREGVNPFNRLHYEGGYSELADRYDINSKDRHVLPDVLEALAQYRAHDPWFPPVISRPYFLGETRGRHAKLWIDVGAALAPGYINQIPTSLRSPARVLYPLPFKREKLLPNLSFANNRYWPALCDLQWKMIAELRARPEESSTIGVLFGDNLVQQLALTTGLTTTLVRRALDEWSTGPDAWLRCSSSERFTFESDAALSMLRDALKIEENARRGGLASAARKRRTTPS